MRTLESAMLAIIGWGVGLALIWAGITWVFAPASAQKLLKNAATAAGAALVALLVLGDFARASSPCMILVALLAASVTAYYIRAQRLRRPDRPARQHGAERTPVMPRRVPGGRL